MAQVPAQDAPGLCFVGFGEVTYHWIRSLARAGYPRSALHVLYLAHGGARENAAEAKAAELGVSLARTPAEVPPQVEMHIHATAPAVASDVLAACVSSLRQGQAWVDLNSAGPATKARMGIEAARAGVDFVDGAIMAPAWKLGHRTPVWISGPGAARFAAWAEHWGTPTVFLGEEAGVAARVKMSRSVIVKGMAAALVEGLVLAEMNGLVGPVLQSLRADFGSDVIDGLCTRLVPGTLRHGERRASEMEGAHELAAQSNWQPRTLDSTAALLRYVGALGSKEVAADSGNYTDLLADVVAKMRNRA